MSDAMRMMKQFEGPSALDLLAQFRKQYVVPLVERRADELRTFLDEHPELGQENRDKYREYDSLRYFDQDLHRLIAAFVNDAVAPWQKAYTDALMQMPTPTFIVNPHA